MYFDVVEKIIVDKNENPLQTTISFTLPDDVWCEFQCKDCWKQVEDFLKNKKEECIPDRPYKTVWSKVNMPTEEIQITKYNFSL